MAMSTLRIIPRAEWGARYQNGAYYQDANRVWRPVILRLPFSEWWAHHSVTAQLPPDATLGQEYAAMRAIEQIGQDRFGQGISYTLIVFPSGRPYEGHGIDRRGAHTAGRNDIARAICWAGNYDQHQPTDAQLLTTAWLLQTHHDRGLCTRRSFSGGHRDLKSTACPGDRYYAALGAINQRAAGPLITERGPLVVVVTCTSPNQAGLLSERDRFVDITNDPSARAAAQAMLNAKAWREMQVGADTYTALKGLA